MANQVTITVGESSTGFLYDPEIPLVDKINGYERKDGEDSERIETLGLVGLTGVEFDFKVGKTVEEVEISSKNQRMVAALFGNPQLPAEFAGHTGLFMGYLSGENPSPLELDENGISLHTGKGLVVTIKTDKLIPNRGGYKIGYKSVHPDGISDPVFIENLELRLIGSDPKPELRTETFNPMELSRKVSGLDCKIAHQGVNLPIVVYGDERFKKGKLMQLTDRLGATCGLGIPEYRQLWSAVNDLRTA